MTCPLLTTPLICPALVGRERELAHARGGCGRTLRLVGEAGVGKSWLVVETITRATEQGFRVLQAHCFEPDRTRPYAALIDLLCPASEPAAPDAVLAWLGPLAPTCSVFCRSMPRSYPILSFHRT